MSGPSREHVRRMIDEALDEIETVEAEMLEMLADVLGPDRAAMVADYIQAAANEPRMAPLTVAGEPRDPDVPGDDPDPDERPGPAR